MADCWQGAPRRRRATPCEHAAPDISPPGVNDESRAACEALGPDMSFTFKRVVGAA